MREASELKITARDAIGGAIIGTLCAVAAHVLGVQQLLRRPELSLYIPTALVGAVLGVTRLRPLLWIAAGIIAVFCVLVAYTPVVSVLARPLIRRDSIPARVDAVAVLSSGITPDGMMASETLEHLLSALALTERGLAPALLVSRERRTLGGKSVSDSADLQNVVALTRPTTPIIFVDSVFTTRTEALRMKTIAGKSGWTTVAVVTSPMHTRRACATFEAVGFRVVCVPAEIREAGLNPATNAEGRLRAFRSWLYETFATDSYRRRGWIP